MKTEQVTKRKNRFAYLSILIVLFVMAYFLTLGRYDIKGTNQGYIFKTDRLTGKTETVTKNGPKDVEPTIDFPIEQLKIEDVSAQIDSYGTRDYPLYNTTFTITLKNDSIYTADKIIFKIELINLETNSTKDTLYEKTDEFIRPGDTVRIGLFFPYKIEDSYRLSVDSAVGL